MALALGKFVSEIDQMSCSEAQNWALYIAENGYATRDPTYLGSAAFMTVVLGLIRAAVGQFAEGLG